MKLYKAKQNLPSCAKDRNIIESDGKYRYADDNTLCMYDCAKEPNFFAEVKPSKYEIGKMIILRDQANVACCSESGEKQRQMFTLPAYTEMKIAGEKERHGVTFIIVKNGDRFYLVPEKLIHKPELYFYVSSKGIIHKAYAGRDKKADVFRKSVGNYCHTKYDAEVYVQVLKEQAKSIIS